MTPPDKPAPAEAAPPPSAPAGGGSKLILLVLVFLMVNLVGTGFVAMKMQKIPKTVSQAVNEGLHPVDAAGQEQKDEHGNLLPPPTASVPPFVVNLNEPSGPHFLKVGMEFELSNQAAVDELERSKRAVRDELLRYLSSLAVADTLGEANKAKIQEQIVARVDKVLGGGRVRRLFFTDFLVQ